MADKAKESQGNDYDPHDHRAVEKGLTYTDALMHFLKGSLGTGILAMPSVFRFSGYGTGLILMTFIPIVAIYGLHIMISSMYVLSKRKRVPILTYADAMTHACESGPRCMQFCAPSVRYIVDFFLAFYPFASCSVYIVFIAESMKQIVDHHWINLDVRIHMCFLTIPLLLLFSIRDINRLTPLSKLANALLFIGFFIVLCYVFTEIPHISERTAFKDYTTIPLFFGTAMFALESVGVIIAVEEKMEAPKTFLGWLGVMNVSMIIVSILNTFIGFMGYWRYGDNVEGSITLNIPEDDVLAQFVKFMFAVAILLTYPLQGYITPEVLCRDYLVIHIANERYHTPVEYIVRIVFVILTLIFGAAVPHLALFASLVGAFSISVLGFIFPAIMQLCINYPDNYGRFKIFLFIDIFVMIFGIIGGVMGTYTSLASIVRA